MVHDESALHSTTSLYSYTPDIFNYVKNVLTQNEIEEILNKVWTPDENYFFPIKSVIVGKEKIPRFLMFQFKWFSSYS